MYKQHDSFKTPVSETIIWRYMDFPKLLSILEYNRLYFSRSDLFEDKHEGAYPISSAKEYEESIEELSKHQQLPYGDKTSEIYRNNSKLMTFINCWHINENESAAMWKLYSASEFSVAIKSNIGMLKTSIENSTVSVFIGLVDYIDYVNDHIQIDNGFNFFLRKRKSFQHENEVRAMLLNTYYNGTNVDFKRMNNTYGINVDCNPQNLIHEIYVSPYAQEWFAKLIEDTIKRYGLKVNVIHSNLYDDPLY